MSDLTFEIVAVWVVARPVNGHKNTKFNHWCVKIQAPPALISIDFLESKKKGAFGLQQTTATDAELADFLHFFVRESNGTKRREKWRIIASVTPSPLKKTSYLKYIDDYNLKKLKTFIKANKSNKQRLDGSELVQHINIKRKVCDISDFLGMWTESKGFNKKKKKSVMDASYNPITKNCQQFAADLFDFLVGHKEEYAQRVKDVRSLFQSPYDQKQNKKNSKASKEKDDCCDDDMKVQHMDVEEDEPEEIENSQSVKAKKALSHLNNPLSPHRVDSVSLDNL